MSKKKKFAGKKTKLAKHALTQVLTQEAADPRPTSAAEEAERSEWSLTQAIEALRDRQLELDLTIIHPPAHPPSRDGAAVHQDSYLTLLQDLYGLRELMGRGAGGSGAVTVIPTSPCLPSEARFQLLVQEARQTLREIRVLMAAD